MYLVGLMGGWYMFLRHVLSAITSGHMSCAPRTDYQLLLWSKPLRTHSS